MHSHTHAGSINPLRKLLRSKSKKKGHTKATNTNNTSTHSHPVTSDYTSKITLFAFQESEISQYKGETDVSDLHVILQSIQPSVMTQGKFKIYSINSIFNYFNCGSLTHPLLPSSKFIKIDSNTYIIPIKNPIRYWKLSLNTTDQRVIGDFEQTVKAIAKLETNMISDFTLTSPFTTFIENTTDTSKSPIIATESLTLHHPTPLRPPTSSTISLTSNSLLNNIDDFSVDTTYSDLDKLENCHDDISITEENPDDDLDDFLNADVATTADSLSLDIDFDISLTDSLNETNETEIKEEQSYDDLFQLWADSDIPDTNIPNSISQRYSLSFKTFDTTKPISSTTISKYKRNIKTLISQDTETSNTGLFGRFLSNV